VAKETIPVPAGIQTLVVKTVADSLYMYAIPTPFYEPISRNSPQNFVLKYLEYLTFARPVLRP
jgi:hypothetical protein